MKLLRQINDLNKAIKRNEMLGFVPTMGGLHKGHENLIKISKKRCKKTIVSIFVNPTQFNDKDDYKKYPKSLNQDLKILKKLKVDYVYLPTTNQIYNKVKSPKFFLKKREKILCAKYRKGHFEGVLDVMNRFVKLLSPKIVFMGEKDYQQFFLIKKLIEKRYSTKVFLCKTIRSSNKVALSTRNKLLSKSDLKICGIISKEIFNIKKLSKYHPKNIKKYLEITKQKIIKKFDINIEYLECRNLDNLGNDIVNKPYKIFIAYYIKNIRLIDNF